MWHTKYYCDFFLVSYSFDIEQQGFTSQIQTLKFYDNYRNHASGKRPKNMILDVEEQ